MRLRALLPAALTCASIARAQQAPSATFVGRVIDETDSGAVAFAEIQIAGTTLVTRADGRGAFRLTRVPTGTARYLVRALVMRRSRATRASRPGPRSVATSI